MNFVYADFWYEGDLPRVVQEHNSALAAHTRRRKLKNEEEKTKKNLNRLRIGRHN